MRPSFTVEESIRELGQKIRTARLRRRLPQSIVSERSGISINTLGKIEKGDPGVSIGNLASVLHALGLDESFRQLASPAFDDVGMMLEEENLPRRIRSKS